MNHEYALGTVINEPEMNEVDIEFQEKSQANQDFSSEDSLDLDPSEASTTQDLPELNLDGFSPAQSAYSMKTAVEAGLMSVINSKRNGKRITLSDPVLKHLGPVDSVEIAFGDDEIAIAGKLPMNGQRFGIKRSSRKATIYSTGAVQEITDKFNLDFENRVSITFHRGRFGMVNGRPVVIIKVNH